LKETRILLLNKVDRIPKDSLLPIIESVGKLTEFRRNNSYFRR